MPDYKETNVTARKWQRCKSIFIENPYQHTPRITIQEEEIVDIAGTKIPQLVGGLSFDFNPEEVIDLLDPTTGDPLNSTITMGEVYAILWSLYMGKAAARDAT